MTVVEPETEGEGAEVIVELEIDADEDDGAIDMLLDTSDDDELTVAEELETGCELETAWELPTEDEALLPRTLEEELLVAICVVDMPNDEEGLDEIA